jgi:hypothetical protein
MYSQYGAVTEPKLSSIEKRSLGIFSTPSDYMVRIVDLTGIPVKISITPSMKKIKSFTSGKTEKVEVVLKKENYINFFKKILAEFNQNETFIYGIVKNHKFFIYDILINENWMNFDLLTFLVENDFKEFKLDLLEPIKMGVFTTVELLDIYSAVFEKYPEKNGKLYILPFFNSINANGYFYIGNNDFHPIGTEGKDDLLYEEVRPITPYVQPLLPNALQEESNKKYYWEYSKQQYIQSAIYRSTNGGIIDLKKNEIDLIEQKPMVANVIFNRQERTALFLTTLKNIKKYLLEQKLDYFSTKDFLPQQKAIVNIAYLYGLWSSMKMRSTVYEFLSKNENSKIEDLYFIDENKGLSALFIALWNTYNSENIKRISKDSKAFMTEEFIGMVLKEEFVLFSQLMMAEYVKFST